MPDSRDISSQTRDAARREAALAWFVRLNSGDATAAERAAFEAWAAADPRHRIAYRRLDGIWRDLDEVTAILPERHPAPAWLSRRHLLRGGAAAAGLAALALAAGLQDWPAAWAADHRTATAERRSVRLTDGSRVDLDAESAIALDFTPARRRLRLLAGRARFIVAQDPARPFAVACEAGMVRALGTVFVVHRRAGDVAVSVQESAVSVSLPAAAAVRLAAGERLSYGPAGISPVGRAGSAEETAWLAGKLVFEDRPLADVIADLQRYRSGRILLWDAALASLRVSGIFDLSRPDATLQAVIATLPVRAVSLTRHLTLLRPA